MAIALARIPDSVEKLSGHEKAAIMLMAVGEEASGQIIESMSPDDVEAISFEIARMERVDPNLVEAVLAEWHHTEEAAVNLATGGVDYAFRVLEKSFGTAKAQTMVKRIESQLHDNVDLNHLRHADPAQLNALIRNEYPQTIALILAFLEPAQTAGIIRGTDPADGSDILLRMASMERVQPDVLQLVEESLGQNSDLSVSGDGSAGGGPSAVAEVLNLLSAGIEKELLDGIAEQDAELSEEIKNLMFVFEDMSKLDDKGVTRLLRDVDTRQLSMALKMASDELRSKILDSMSSRARDSLEEEMEFLGPVRVSDVETAQAEIVKMARALEEAGEIVIGSTDEAVVE